MSYTASFAVAGGSTTAVVAASVATNTVIKATPGRLCRVLVTTLAGAAVTNFYDNATTAAGTVIAMIAASAAAGTMVVIEMPAAAGITVGGAATNPAMTISFD
jgi:hypothetical protein